MSSTFAGGFPRSSLTGAKMPLSELVGICGHKNPQRTLLRTEAFYQEIGIILAMEYVSFDSYRGWDPPRIAARCPYCGNSGTFEPVGIQDVGKQSGTRKFGHRRCPNPKCHAHIFCVLNDHDELMGMVPTQRIDFDTKNIPDSIIATLTEAITCHADSCYKASAMMVRRTLEELCELHAAKGKDLKAKIVALREKVTLPKPLLEGLDDLRLLGNDAAHIEAKVFENIGAEEVALAIDVTKEILKAIYQYDTLISRFAAFKKKTEAVAA